MESDVTKSRMSVTGPALIVRLSDCGFVLAAQRLHLRALVWPNYANVYTRPCSGRTAKNLYLFESVAGRGYRCVLCGPAKNQRAAH